jgi:hypothetical protein
MCRVSINTCTTGVSPRRLRHATCLTMQLRNPPSRAHEMRGTAQVAWQSAAGLSHEYSPPTGIQGETRTAAQPWRQQSCSFFQKLGVFSRTRAPRDELQPPASNSFACLYSSVIAGPIQNRIFTCSVQPRLSSAHINATSQP